MGCRTSKGKQQEEDPLPTLNLLILGLASSGKTTILNKIKGKAQEADEELGIYTLVMNKQIKLIAFKVAGRAHATWHHFYSTANIVIFVIDVTQLDEIQKIKSMLRAMDEQLPARAKILIAYNKIDTLMKAQAQNLSAEDKKNCDLNKYLKPNRKQIIKINDLKFDFLQHEVQTCRCSGLTEIGIDSLMKKVYEAAYREVYREDLTQQEQTTQDKKAGEAVQ